MCSSSVMPTQFKEKAKGKKNFQRKASLFFWKRRWHLLRCAPDLKTAIVNEGFSGGEKKRNEILQMAVLDPKLAVLDETDSGLDIDAMRIVANGVNKLSQMSMHFSSSPTIKGFSNILNLTSSMS